LKDGQRAINWTENFDLMPTDIQKDFYRDTAKATKAVVKGHIFVALSTGILTGIGLFATGIPNSIFWTFIATIAGLIPIDCWNWFDMGACRSLSVSGRFNPFSSVADISWRCSWKKR